MAFRVSVTSPFRDPEEETSYYGQSLDDWAKDKPLSILQLDPADRAVLRIAGMFIYSEFLLQRVVI